MIFPCNKKASLVVIVLLGILGNHFKLPLSFGVDFIFGSIASLLVLLEFGILPATLSAALISSYTYILWGHPYAAIVFTLEVFFVGAIRARRRHNIVLLDTVYWMTIGMPLVLFFYRYLVGMDTSDAILVMLKQATNGIFNALVANFIFLYVCPLLLQKRKPALPLQDVLFSTIACLVIIPAIAIITTNNHRAYHRMTEEVDDKLTNIAKHSKKTINMWAQENYQTVQSLGFLIARLGVTPTPALQHDMAVLRGHDQNFREMGICNSQGIVVAVDPPPRRAGDTRIGQDLSATPSFRLARKTGKPAISDLQHSFHGTPDGTVLLTSPLLAKGTLQGYVFGSIELHHLNSLFRDLTGTWDTNSRGVILDQQNHIVATTSSGEATYTPRHSTVSLGNGVAMEYGKGGPSPMQKWRNAVFFTDSQIPTTGWSVHLELPTAPYINTLNDTLINAFIILLGLFFSAVLLSHWISKLLSKAIVQLAAISTDVPGQLARHEAIQFPDSQIAEVAHMCDNISEMVEQLRSDRLKLEAAQHKAEIESVAKSEFIANVSHEVRTPLNAIIGMADMALEKIETPEAGDYFHMIRLSGQTMLSLVNDILDFSKLEAGRLELEQVPFSLRTMLEETISVFRYLAQRKGVALNCTVAPDLPDGYRGDPLRLKQVLMNLVNNALKFTDQGHIEVQIRRPASDGPLIFSVADTGIGIPADRQEMIFQRFAQAGAATSRTFGGTGLGLSICTTLIGLMDGHFHLDSTEGVGSTFSFEVCLAEVDLSAETPAAEATEPTVTVRPCRILLVEDVPFNQLFATTLLEEHGHRVRVAANGREALEALQEERFELVLMDLQMPEMDGMEATSLIRASRKPRISEVPIVAMTANAYSEDRERCLEAGMNDYITKPISIKNLTRVIATFAQ